MQAMAGLINFLRSESGAVAVEYGLMIAFISLAIVGAVATLGSTVRDTLYGEFLTKFQN